jgi:hypothetical protein
MLKWTVVSLVRKNKVVAGENFYQWHKNWYKLQKSFFHEPHEIYEKVKIEKFIHNNGFKKVFHLKDNYVDYNFTTVDNINHADLVLITEQKFSRFTCKKIISNIKKLLEKCDNIFLCLNRNYLNITGMETDESLPDDYQDAIHVWLEKSLNMKIKNYSERFIEDGNYFTWVIPDQKFHIKK